jgi:hypothetical protein
MISPMDQPTRGYGIYRAEAFCTQRWLNGYGAGKSHVSSGESELLSRCASQDYDVGCEASWRWHMHPHVSLAQLPMAILQLAATGQLHWEGSH